MTTAYTPSFRDPSSQLRINNWSWYGRLVKSIYGGKTDDEALAIADLQDRLAQTVDRVFSDATTDLSRSLSKAIAHNRVQFRLIADTADDSYKNVTIFVDDGINTPYYEKGSGIQSALIIGLFAFYCRQFHAGSSLLLVEEPEIYLHPQARRAIQQRLVDFTQSRDGGGCDGQVIISTHSTEFLRGITLPHLCCVRKNETGTTTTVIQVSASGIGIDEARQRQITSSKNTEMFFADKAIIVEGGEEYLMAPIADMLHEPGILDLRNISVVRANGKMQFAEYWQTCQAFGVEPSLLADLDFVLQGLERFKNLELFDDAFWQALDLLKQTIGAAMATHTLQGDRIRDKLFDPDTRDWRDVYEQVDSALSLLASGLPVPDEQRKAIAALWCRLGRRLAPDDIRTTLDDEQQDALDSLITCARERRIFILRRGDLEAYMTQQALSLDHSKDRRALELASRIQACETREEVARWVDVTEIEELLKHVLA